MKSLEEVFEAIEAFKEDMEGLGVEVTVSSAYAEYLEAKGPSITQISLVLPNLEKEEVSGL